jgi:microcompartment protein CcmK/EutM
MQLARIIGTCVATRKVKALEGHRLLILQPLDFDLEPAGNPAVAVDIVRAGRGELVFFVRSREAANSLPDSFCPADAAVVGIADEVGMLRSEGQPEGQKPAGLVWHREGDAS